MSAVRSFFSHVFSWTYLGGLGLGLVLGIAGMVVGARYMMTQSNRDAQTTVHLPTPEPPTRTTLATYGAVPDDWTLRRIGAADSTSFSALRGRPVLVNMWATWCSPCKAEMPTLQALHDTTAANVRLAVISTESRDHVRRYIDNANYSMPVYVVDEVPPALDGYAIPRTYVIRPDGQVVYRHTGVADWNTAPVHRFLDRVGPTHAAAGSP